MSDRSNGQGTAGDDDRRRGPFDRRFLDQAAGVRRLLVVDVAAGLAGTLLLLAQVVLIAGVVADAAQGRITSVDPWVLALLAAVILGRAGLTRVVEVSGRRAASQVMSSLRAQLVARRLHRGGPGLDDVDAAELATAAVQGVDGLETYFARYLPQLVLSVTVPLAVLILSAAIDLESAVIMAITLPVIPVFMVLIGRSAAARSEANFTALARLSSHFLDVVRGLPTLRAFNRGHAQGPLIEVATETYRRTTMGTLRLAFLSGLVLDLAATLGTALVAVTLGVRLVGGGIELKPALTVLLLVPELYAPIRAVGSLFHASTDGIAAAERIFDLLDRPGTGPDEAGRAPGPSSDAPPDPRAEAVEARGISVRFEGREIPALDGLDLRIDPGEVVAVIGPSGVGKTTLARVLLGLLDPDEGSVQVGATVVSPGGTDRWRERLAWAPQRPGILHGTVRHNIALGRPDASLEEVRTAAAAAGADAFVADLPDGYDTVIGTGGRGLSAGQRQRLGLARALLRDASLVVLDEPTAFLDRDAVAVVGQAIDALRGRSSVLLLTHDADLAAGADRVVELRAGRALAGGRGR